MAQPEPGLPARYFITVRAPEPNDYGKMADLASQLGYQCTETELNLRLSSMQDSNQYAVYVAQTSHGEVAGWVGVHIFRSVETEMCAEITGLVVDKQIRSRGIGRELLQAAETWARKVGCKEISVHSNVKRVRAHEFYKKNGYEVVKTQALFRKSI